YATNFPGRWSPGGIAAPAYGNNFGNTVYTGYSLLSGMAAPGFPYVTPAGMNYVSGLDAYAYGPFSTGGSNSLNLAVGVGDEGVLKKAMATVLAKQAMPEYAAKVRQVYNEVATSKPGAITAAGYSEDSGFKRGD